jgi:diguanylate cyclase (GGDEF)-like protein
MCPAGRPVALVADFDRERLETTRAALEEAGLEVRTAGDGGEALDRARAALPQVLVLEALLPRRNGFEVLKALKEDGTTAGIRVVMILDPGDGYGRHRARAGGADLLLERPFDEADLLAAIRETCEDRAQEEFDEGEALAEVVEALEDRARLENPVLAHITDASTGLYNAAYTEIKLAEEYKKARRFHVPLTCVVLGLDEPQAGVEPEDEAALRRTINELAGLLLCESRDIDHLARTGGREFVALLPHTDTHGGVLMAERILASIAGRRFTTGAERPVTASAGVATFAGEGLEAADRLLDRARTGLARSRAWGGNRCTVWQDDGVPSDL